MIESWDAEGLFERSAQYVEYAYEHDREDPRFGIWLVLSLEQLARAALASRHPVLLAALKEDQLLHAFGVATSDPQSLGAASVFARCSKLLPRFSEQERKFCNRMSRMRNAALHTSERSFESTPTSLWFAPYVRVASILLESMGRQPSDLFPADTLSTITTVLSSNAEVVRIAVEKRIGRARKAFDALPDEIQEATRDRSIKDAQNDLSTSCPACGGRGWVEGVSAGQLAPLVSESAVGPRFAVRPSAFHCLSCSLELDGWDELEAAGLGSEMVEMDLPIFIDDPDFE